MSDKGFDAPKQLSRRDALKVLFNVGGMAVLSKPAEFFAKAVERPAIETKNAKYFAFYERHDMDLSLEELNQIGTTDVYFSECAMDAKTSNDLDAGSFTNLSVLMSSGEAKRLFPDVFLNQFVNEGTSIAIEGMSIGSLKQISDVSKNVEIISSNVILLEETIRVLYNKFKKKDKWLSGQKISASTALGYWMWAMSPDIVEASMVAVEQALPNADDTQKDLQSIHKLVGKLHPEYLNIALRDILMARRLQTVGKHLYDKNSEKPRVAYRAGLAHSGIERFLSIGDELTLDALDIYPKQVLKRIVEDNDTSSNDFEEKLNMFCSFSLVNPQKNTKEKVVDNDLKDYLRQRFLDF